MSAEYARVELTPIKDPERKMLSRIEIKVHLPASFPRKYEKAIVKAVDACTVKKAVLDPPAFDVRVAIAAEPGREPA